MTEWTDLDDDYLAIFGEHPDLVAVVIPFPDRPPTALLSMGHSDDSGMTH